MKKLFALSILAIAFIACSNGQSTTEKTNLNATEFAAKIQDLPAATLIDVRTPDEFSKGHLQNAVNWDWNGNAFDEQISGLDKTKPVLVYCLSGGRSGAAASHMRNAGFKQVFELSGGIMKWRAANLPETTDNAVHSAGMTKQQFEAQLATDKTVLIDFYADWCAPCKKMKPYLDEISRDMAESVTVIRINADDNQSLCKELGIDALPVLQVYKAQKQTWSNVGFVEKEQVVEKLK